MIGVQTSPLTTTSPVITSNWLIRENILLMNQHPPIHDKVEYVRLPQIHLCKSTCNCSRKNSKNPRNPLKLVHKQECTPVGCVPPAAVAIRGVSTRHPPLEQTPSPGSRSPQSRPPGPPLLQGMLG